MREGGGARWMLLVGTIIALSLAECASYAVFRWCYRGQIVGGRDVEPHIEVFVRGESLACRAWVWSCWPCMMVEHRLTGVCFWATDFGPNKSRIWLEVP